MEESIHSDSESPSIPSFDISVRDVKATSQMITTACEYNVALAKVYCGIDYVVKLSILSPPSISLSFCSLLVWS